MAYQIMNPERFYRLHRAVQKAVREWAEVESPLGNHAKITVDDDGEGEIQILLMIDRETRTHERAFIQVLIEDTDINGS